MTSTSFNIRRNDTAPPITATLEAGDPVSAVDLTGAAVRFHMEDSSGTVRVDADANIDDAEEGEVSYDWTAADTESAGWFKAEWEVTFADSTVRTFPNPGVTTVRISGDIA